MCKLSFRQVLDYAWIDNVHKLLCGDVSTCYRKRWALQVLRRWSAFVVGVTCVLAVRCRPLLQCGWSVVVFKLPRGPIPVDHRS